MPRSAPPKILARLKGWRRNRPLVQMRTPLISDPSFKLVQAARASGPAVTAVPGCFRCLAALTASGLPPDGFFFGGLPAAARGPRAAPASMNSPTCPRLLGFSKRRDRRQCSMRSPPTGGGRQRRCALSSPTAWRDISAASFVVWHLRGPIGRRETRGSSRRLVGPPAERANIRGNRCARRHFKRALATASLKDAV